METIDQAPAPAADKPRYRHDCERCSFVGVFTQNGLRQDLYHCHQAPFEETVIARWGFDGNYSSSMCFAYGSNPALTSARRLAAKAGLTEFNLFDGLHYTSPTGDAESLAELKAQLLSSQVLIVLQQIRSSPVAAYDKVRAFMDREKRARAERFRSARLEDFEDTGRIFLLKANEWMRRFEMQNVRERDLYEILARVVIDDTEVPGLASD